jgi:hypothetical protein
VSSDAGGDLNASCTAEYDCKPNSRYRQPQARSLSVCTDQRLPPHRNLRPPMSCPSLTSRGHFSSKATRGYRRRSDISPNRLGHTLRSTLAGSSIATSRMASRTFSLRPNSTKESSLHRCRNTGKRIAGLPSRGAGQRRYRSRRQLRCRADRVYVRSEKHCRSCPLLASHAARAGAIQTSNDHPRSWFADACHLLDVNRPGFPPSDTRFLFEQTNWRLRHLSNSNHPATVPLGDKNWCHGSSAENAKSP